MTIQQQSFRSNMTKNKGSLFCSTIDIVSSPPRWVQKTTGEVILVSPRDECTIQQSCKQRCCLLSLFNSKSHNKPEAPTLLAEMGLLRLWQLVVHNSAVKRPDYVVTKLQLLIPPQINRQKENIDHGFISLSSNIQLSQTIVNEQQCNCHSPE